MFYKNWPYWLKGGITSLIIIFILIVLFFASMIGVRISNIKFLIVILSLIPATIFGYETCFMAGNPDCRPSTPEFFSVFGWLILILGIFLISAVIGLIYGKIKNKINIIKK